ncbi:hypothetical protein ACFYQ5_01270 [Streptomyces sp. NPDC005794]|uniref:hypothetical protein n=1 Tax=Streptomyces sp. NPDC005794 TaxID=3364733 RepID=UPI0036ADB199
MDAARRRDGRTAEIQAGWSSIEGWGICPSDYLSTTPDETDFAPIAARVERTLIALAARVEANRVALAAIGP